MPLNKIMKYFESIEHFYFNFCVTNMVEILRTAAFQSIISCISNNF